MVSIFKVSLVYIVYKVFSKYIYLLALTRIVAVIDFVGKSKYQLFYLWRDEFLK